MSNQQDNDKKISNARLALLVAIVPVALFIAAFFIMQQA
jgi:hypothetical protein